VATATHGAMTIANPIGGTAQTAHQQIYINRMYLETSNSAKSLSTRSTMKRRNVIVLATLPVVIAAAVSTNECRSDELGADVRFG